MRVTDSTKPSKPFFIGVSGGSGSGKTYFATAVQKKIGKKLCSIISQDNFYIDQSKNFDFDGGSVNFDHPNSLDFGLLAEVIVNLKTGKKTEIPIYDFKTHSRKNETITIEPTPIVIIDGILIFQAEQVRPLLDDLIFFETPEELRFSRRLERDVKERGRDPEGVKNQFYKQVKPMHDEFVEPSKIHAKTIVKDLSSYDKVLESSCAVLNKIIQKL